MNKREFIEVLSTNCRVTKKSTKKFLDGFIETLSETLNNGENIQITGFGTFITKDIEEHIAFNPKTQEQIVIKPKKVIKFKPGKGLLEDVNKNTCNQQYFSKYNFNKDYKRV